METLELAKRMADSFMKRHGLLTRGWHYDYGVIWRGMEALYALTGQDRYLEYIRQALDALVDEDGSIHGYQAEELNLDYICDGRQLLYLYRRTGEEKYLSAARTLREQLRRQPRTSDGGFWHKQCYPYQMWLDGLHMAAPFYLEIALETGEGQETVDDVARQLRLAYEHTLNPETGLNQHAWDESKRQPWADPVTGRAAHSWGRAVGWYLTALADCLELLGRDNPRSAELEAIYLRMADKLLSIRREGVWMQVLDCPEREGNYIESSGSCLITYALLIGARLGLLDAERRRQAIDSFHDVCRHFVFQMNDGLTFVAKCCHGAGLGGPSGRDGSYAYYISEDVGSHDPKATGAFVQAACEMERLCGHEVQ